MVSEADSVSFGGIPVAGFSSDSGFGFGGLLQYISYEEGFDNFSRKFRARSTIFLRGKIHSEIEYEQWFQTGNRISLTATGQIDPDALYFGQGIDASFSRRSFREELYHYRREMLALEALFGVQLSAEGGVRQELKTGYMVGVQRNSQDQGSRLDQVRPFGIQGGFRNALIVGYSYDARNHLVRASGGGRLAVRLDVIPALTGNRATLLKTETSAAAFHPIGELAGEPLVLAGRVRYQQLIGRAPFYEQPTLGDELSLRGYPLERFRDNGNLLLTAEIRGWLFRLPWFNAQVGGHLFSDAGTVFLHPAQSLSPDQWRATGGAGGVISVFSRDFILRGDLAFSQETWRIYAGLGYTF